MELKKLNEQVFGDVRQAVEEMARNPVEEDEEVDVMRALENEVHILHRDIDPH